MRSVKFSVLSNGDIIPVQIGTPRGYSSENPVIEISGVPDNLTDSDLRRTYKRCIMMPVKHADIIVAWNKIEGAQDGQVIRLTRGRPAKDGVQRAIRVNISLSPSALALIDAQEGNRSGLIERMIFDRFGGPVKGQP